MPIHRYGRGHTLRAGRNTGERRDGARDVGGSVRTSRLVTAEGVCWVVHGAQIDWPEAWCAEITSPRVNLRDYISEAWCAEMRLDIQGGLQLLGEVGLTTAGAFAIGTLLTLRRAAAPATPGGPAASSTATAAALSVSSAAAPVWTLESQLHAGARSRFT